MEPFKNAFNPSLIEHIANCFTTVWPEFQKNTFITIASNNLETLALKQRSEQILLALQATLPEQLIDGEKIILSTLSSAKNETDEVLFSQDFQAPQQTAGIDGWAIMPIADYVGKQALNNISLRPEQKTQIITCAMTLFNALTQRFSAEFGIRFLLNAFPEEILAILATWLEHPSQHVRRLISEGTRPRLPWGMQLPIFIKQPELILPLLTALKDDNEEYVRRSVANNLNDIAKDHPELLNDTIAVWLKGANKNRLRLINHAARTLIKQGNKNTLKLLGYKPANIDNIRFNLSNSTLNFGQSIILSLAFESTTENKQKLIIDYVVHHQKANGKTSAKTFKWKTCTLNGKKTFNADKKHTIKAITTRVYYPGVHQIDIMINGEKKAQASFNLLMP